MYTDILTLQYFIIMKVSKLRFIPLDMEQDLRTFMEHLRSPLVLGWVRVV